MQKNKVNKNCDCEFSCTRPFVKILFIYFLERGEGKETGRERNTDV